jgi:hypothetical protein
MPLQVEISSVQLCMYIGTFARCVFGTTRVSLEELVLCCSGTLAETQALFIAIFRGLPRGSEMEFSCQVAL